MNCYLQNTSLVSPAGILVRPRTEEVINGNMKQVYGKWICPKTGQVFKHGIISEEKINKNEN